ncbi:MAG: DUF305 domain-containing protein [Candidatus Doudnabacteria bacterium]
MDNKKLAYALGGLAVGVILTAFFASFAFNSRNYGMMGMMGFNSTYFQSGASNGIDQHFIEQMIPHHDDAVTMAKIALTKAEHSEIKELSKNIIKAQTDEISKMTEWYKSWFGSDVPDKFVNAGHGLGSGMMHGGMMGGSVDIVDLETAKPFDREFITEMIPHHQSAVMMAQMLKASTNRTEMASLADDIISSQSKEIEQMREWYNNWYK